MREELVAILKSVREDVDFETELRLVDGNVLDSFDIVNIVPAINETFGVQIGVAELVPENFNSLDAMLALIDKLQNEF